jgi:hypothetical protein
VSEFVAIRCKAKEDKRKRKEKEEKRKLTERFAEQVYLSGSSRET